MGRLYRAHYLVPAWARWPDAETNPWHALTIFVSGYAFERQGRPARFPLMAGEVAETLAAKGRDLTDPGLARLAWERFAARLGGQNLNCATNPMAPQGSAYQRKTGPATTTGLSVFEVARNHPDGLVSFARRLIRRGEFAEAHQTLAAINGVGTKIASFFLRDIVLYFEMEPLETDRHLLQPIDLWERRAAHGVLGNLPPHVADQARQIVRASVLDSANPESVNAGMWYFGALLARSEARLRSCCRDRAQFLQAVQAHIEAMRATVHAYEGLVAAGQFAR